MARKTWAFFETCVGPEDNWLPPDNLQEQAGCRACAAHIADQYRPFAAGHLAACDFGYIQAGTLIERTDNTLRSMALLERHQGHFYNWYDTQHLKPLYPIYISTVDSGNLAGHLLILAAGLAGADRPAKSWGHGCLTESTTHSKYCWVFLQDSAPAQLAKFQTDLDTARDAQFRHPADYACHLFQLHGQAGKQGCGICRQSRYRSGQRTEMVGQCTGQGNAVLRATK